MNVSNTKLLRVESSGTMDSRSREVCESFWPTRNLIASRTKEHFQLRMAPVLRLRHLMAAISYLLPLIEVYVLHSCKPPFSYLRKFRLLARGCGKDTPSIDPLSTSRQPSSHIVTVSLIQMNCLC